MDWERELGEDDVMVSKFETASSLERNGREKGEDEREKGLLCLWIRKKEGNRGSRRFI